MSPCTQVMGITVLPLPFVGTTFGWARLTELPESNYALTGRPSILTLLSGAPEGIARCTIQPASHAHTSDGLGSVGMGSSRGPIMTGLPTGLEVPSSGRRSLGTLRGNPLALFPISCAWATSANSTPCTNSHLVTGFCIPTAFRCTWGRDRSSLSTTTFSVTCNAVG